MAAPDSEVFYFQEGAIAKVDYRETEHYRLTKAVIQSPEVVMNEL